MLIIRYNIVEQMFKNQVVFFEKFQIAVLMFSFAYLYRHEIYSVRQLQQLAADDVIDLYSCMWLSVFTAMSRD